MQLLFTQSPFWTVAWGEHLSSESVTVTKPPYSHACHNFSHLQDNQDNITDQACQDEVFYYELMEVSDFRWENVGESVEVVLAHVSVCVLRKLVCDGAFPNIMSCSPVSCTLRPSFMLMYLTSHCQDTQ